MEPQDLIGGHPLALEVYRRVREVLESEGPLEVRTSKSQIAFRARLTIAWLWLPGQYLTRPQAEVVLSIGLGRRIDSPRFKQVVRPAAGQWMHHLEIRAADDVDAEVEGWLREAANRA